MPAVHIIADARELAQFTAALDGEVAVDTEFLRERTFAPKLCLIQLTDGAQTACVDPLAVADLSPLGALLADSSRGKIFHSCRQDLEAFDTRFDARTAALYDTQLAAAFCGYGAQVSYAALVESICQVRLPKAHTRADWSRRPLPTEALEYALDDIKYLQPLRAHFDRELQARGYADWHLAECQDATRPAHYRVDPAAAWLRVRGVARLDAAGQSCARLLAAWRERRAIRSDRPRNWILPADALLGICRKRPATLEKLTAINHLAPGVVKHAGRQILDLIAQGKREAADHPPPPRATAWQRAFAKRLTERIAAIAEDTGISQTLIASRPEVEAFARFVEGGGGGDGGDGEVDGGDGEVDGDAPRLNRGWRRELIGEAFLAR